MTFDAQSPYTNVYQNNGKGADFPTSGTDAYIVRGFPASNSIPVASTAKFYFNVDFINNSAPSGIGKYTIVISGPGASAINASVAFDVTGTQLYAKSSAAGQPTSEAILTLQPNTWYNLQATLDMATKTYSGFVSTLAGRTIISSRPFIKTGQVIDTVFSDTSSFGGPWPSHNLDNWALSTIPLAPAFPEPFVISTSPSGSAVAPDAVVAVVLQDNVTQVVTNSIQLCFNGLAVTPTISKSADVTTITYDPPGELASQSTNTVRIVFGDTSTPPIVVTNEFSFVVKKILPGQPRVQDAGADKLLVLEAEHFVLNTPGGGSSWIFTTAPPLVLPTDVNTNFSGDGAMLADPNAGRNIGSPALGTVPADSPSLDFKVQFVAAGTYYVWLRGVGDSAPGPSVDDSVFIGLDGALTTRLTGFPQGQGYYWGNSPIGNSGPIVITTAGVYVINAWMREDGFAVDKILLTSNQSFTPTGLGPTESPLAPLQLSIARQGSNLVISWDESTATLQSADAVTGPWADVSGATSPHTVTPVGTKFYRLKQ